MSYDLKKIIKLKTQDGFIVESVLEIVQNLGIVEDLLNTIEIDDFDEPIPVTGVKKTILEIILKWIEVHKDDPIMDIEPKDISNQIVNQFSKWVAEFLESQNSGKPEEIQYTSQNQKQDQEQRQELILNIYQGSMYLDVIPLILLTSQWAAYIIHPKYNDWEDEKTEIINEEQCTEHDDSMNDKDVLNDMINEKELKQPSENDTNKDTDIIAALRELNTQSFEENEESNKGIGFQEIIQQWDSFSIDQILNPSMKPSAVESHDFLETKISSYVDLENAGIPEMILPDLIIPNKSTKLILTKKKEDEPCEDCWIYCGADGNADSKN